MVPSIKNSNPLKDYTLLHESKRHTKESLFNTIDTSVAIISGDLPNKKQNLKFKKLSIKR